MINGRGLILKLTALLTENEEKEIFMKKLYLVLLTALLVTASSVSAFAEGWKQDSGEYYFEKSNGERARNEWIYSQNEGYWYYMGANSYLLKSTITPDGYKVNAKGHWIDEANLSRDPNEYDRTYINLMLYCAFNDFYLNSPVNSNYNKKRESLTSADKAFITYVYIYHDQSGDRRVREADEGYAIYKVISKGDAMSIMKDLTGSSNESDMSEFAKYGKLHGNDYWIEGGGDFSDIGIRYIFDGKEELTVEGNRIKVTGNVVHNDARDIPFKRYTAYFTISDAPQMGFLRLDEFSVW